MLLRNIGLLLFLLNSILVFGGKNTWLGQGDGFSYSDPMNWSLGYSPTPSDTVYIFDADSVVATSSILAQRVEIKRSTLVHLGSQISANTILIQQSTILGTRSILSGQLVEIGGKNQGNQIHQVLQIYSESFRAGENVFHAPITISKTGNSNDFLHGGNTFLDTVEINNTSSGSMTFSGIDSDQYEGLVRVNLSNSGSINFSNNGTYTLFRRGIQASLNGGTIKFGQAMGYTEIRGGFVLDCVNGQVWLQNADFQDPITLVGDASSVLKIQNNTRFIQGLVAEMGSFQVQNATFSGLTQMRKTGGNNDVWGGGNVFETWAEVENSGSGFIILDDQLPNTYGGTFNIRFSGAGNVFLGHNNENNRISTPLMIRSSGGTGGLNVGQKLGAFFIENGGSISVDPEVAFLGLGNFNYQSSDIFNIALTNQGKIHIQENGVFQSEVHLSAGSIVVDSSHFSSAVFIRKTGNVSDFWDGGSYFENGLFLELEDGGLYLGKKFPSAVAQTLEVTRLSNAKLYLAHEAVGSSYENLKILEATNAEIKVGQQGGSALFTGNQPIYLQDNKIKNTDLYLKNTDISSVSLVRITMDNESVAVFQKGTTISAPLEVVSGGIRLDSALFEGSVLFTKTGNSYDYSTGGNRFLGSTTLNNTGTGTLTLGGVNPDIFNGSTEFGNSGNGSIYLAYGCLSPTIFRGQVVIKNEEGIFRTGPNKGLTRFESNSSLNLDSAYNHGSQIHFKNIAFNQLNGINIEASSATNLTLDSCQFSGSLRINAGWINFLKNRVQGDLTLEKRGGIGSYCWGANEIFGETHISNLGDGVIAMASTEPDTYWGTVFVSNQQEGMVSMAHGAVGNVFKGDVHIESQGGSVQFGLANGTMSAQDIVQGQGAIVNTDVYFSGAQLRGTAGWFSADAESSINFSDGCGFTNEAWFNFGGVRFGGTEFNDVVRIQKTGVFSDNGTGGNVFNRAVYLELSGGEFHFSGQQEPDVFEDFLFVSGTNSNLFFGKNKASTIFSANSGIRAFSDGFRGGKLEMAYVHFQEGSTFDIQGDGNTRTTFGPFSIFEVPVAYSGNAMLRDSEFFKPVFLEHSGLQHWVETGNNVFQDTVEIIHKGATNWGFNHNTFHKQVNLSVNGSGSLYIGEMYLHGGLRFKSEGNTPSPVFVDKVEAVGSGDQNFDLDVYEAFKVDSLVINKPQGLVNLDFGTLAIKEGLVFGGGKIYNNNGDLQLLAQAKVIGFSETAYVVGKMKKIGGVDVLLPIGSDNLYRPVGYLNYGGQNAEVEVAFVPEPFTSVGPLPAKVEFLSACGYWQFASDDDNLLIPKLHLWEEEACIPYDVPELEGVIEFEDGNLITTPMIEVASEVSDYTSVELDDYVSGNFSAVVGAPFKFRPIEFEVQDFVVQRDGLSNARISLNIIGETETELYELQRSINGGEFERLKDVPAKGNPNLASYSFSDTIVKPGQYAYRIRQKYDFGKSTYTETRGLFVGEDHKLEVYPNPVQDHFFLDFSITKESKLEIFFLDVSGRRIAKVEKSKGSGSEVMRVDIPRWFKDGWYFVEIISGTRRYSSKVLVQQ